MIKEIMFKLVPKDGQPLFRIEEKRIQDWMEVNSLIGNVRGMHPQEKIIV